MSRVKPIYHKDSAGVGGPSTGALFRFEVRLFILLHSIYINSVNEGFGLSRASIRLQSGSARRGLHQIVLMCLQERQSY